MQWYAMRQFAYRLMSGLPVFDYEPVEKNDNEAMALAVQRMKKTTGKTVLDMGDVMQDMLRRK